MQSEAPGRRLIFAVYLLAWSLAGMAAIYLATYRFGAGLSTDAVNNLAAASHLLQGRGLVDVYGGPLVQWPPLYAWLLAALSLLTGADVFQVGWHLNALAFGASIFCTGLLIRHTFPDTPVFAYTGAPVIATCLGIVQISANIASDPLLLLFTVLFLIFAGRYGAQRRRRDLFWMGLAAVLGSFQRYAGLALVVAGAGALVYIHRRRLPAALARGAAFFVVAAAPIFAWGAFHNRPVTGQMFGSHLQADIPGNLYAAVEKLLYWFLPFSLIQRATPYAILGLLLVALLLLNRRGNWSEWFRLLASDGQIASTLFFVIYGGMLVSYVSYSEHRNLESQRIHMVILPSLLLLIFSSIRELVPPRPASPALPRKQRALALLAALWLVYPAAKLWDYESRSAGVEVSGTNLYNTAAIHEGNFLRAAQALPATGQAIYSNYEAPAWFYLRLDIGSVPRRVKGGALDPAGQAAFQASTVQSGGGYLVWFNTVHIRENLPDPGQLEPLVKMEPALLSPAGDIYRLAPPGP